MKRALDTYFENNQAMLDGTMSTFELACWTAFMAVVGTLMMAALWVLSR
ncbi:hypothetical protein AAK967_06485 [Atopobiaceae bacterium 24-176]